MPWRDCALKGKSHPAVHPDDFHVSDDFHSQPFIFNFEKYEPAKYVCRASYPLYYIRLAHGDLVINEFLQSTAEGLRGSGNH